MFLILTSGVPQASQGYFAYMDFCGRM